MSTDAERLAATSLEEAMKNTTSAVTNQVQQFNAQLQAAYATAFNNWAISVGAGRIDNTDPPKPPKMYIVASFRDLTGGNIPAIWSYPSQTGPELPSLPIPPSNLAKPTPQAISDHLRNVPLGDMVPVGVTVTDASGVQWQKQASATPFGMAYFYARVN